LESIGPTNQPKKQGINMLEQAWGSENAMTWQQKLLQNEDIID